MDINWGHVLLDCFDGAMDKAITVATNFDANNTKEELKGSWYYVELQDRHKVSLIKFKYNMYNNKFQLLENVNFDNYNLY